MLNLGFLKSVKMWHYVFFPNLLIPNEQYNPNNVIIPNAVILTSFFWSGWILPSPLGPSPGIHPSGVGAALLGLGVWEIENLGLYRSGLVHSRKRRRPSKGIVRQQKLDTLALSLLIHACCANFSKGVGKKGLTKSGQDHKQNPKPCKRALKITSFESQGICSFDLPTVGLIKCFMQSPPQSNCIFFLHIKLNVIAIFEPF